VVSMTKTRLGVLPCPAVGYVGSEAKTVFGGSTGASWLQPHVSQDPSVFVHTAGPIQTADNATRLSAPTERSP
jgi:hypothetical protein